MRYYEITKMLKEDGDAAPAASGATTAASVATCVSALGVYPQTGDKKKKKTKPVVIKRYP